MSAVRLLPWPVHEAFEYLAGIFLILAPFVLGFRDSPAFPVAIAIGVVLLAMAVLSGGRLGVVAVLPSPFHAALDYVAGFGLILAPFVFSFSDVDAALYASLFAGLAHLVVSLLTSYPRAEREAEATGRA